MELHVETNPALNTVTGYGNGHIEINAVPYAYAIYFGPEGEIKPWGIATVEEISADRLREAAGLGKIAADPLAFLDAAPAPQAAGGPEVMLVGTGRKQHFLARDVTAELLALGIGVEIMDTQAAARTYNILMSEGRHVIAALLPLGEESK